MSSDAGASLASTPGASTQQEPVPSVRRKKPTATALDELITAGVGKPGAKKTFKIYKGLLCFYSDFFGAALNGNFAEATEKIVRLEDVNVRVFKIFQSWLLFGELSERCGKLGMSFPLVNIYHVWLFGDRFLIPLLKNEAMDLLIGKMGQSKTIYSDLRNVYERTATGSLLRRLLIDVIIYTNARCTVEQKGEFENRWNEESRRDLVLALFDRPRNYKLWIAPLSEIDHCQYHGHGPDGEEHETCRNIRDKRNQLAEEERLEKKIFDTRHRLQEAFFPPGKTLKEEEMKDLSKLFTELESVEPKLQVAQRQAMHSAKTAEVLRAIAGLDSIPKDEVYEFKKRSNSLLAKWSNERKASEINS